MLYQGLARILAGVVGSEHAIKRIAVKTHCPGEHSAQEKAITPRCGAGARSLMRPEAGLSATQGPVARIRNGAGAICIRQGLLHEPKSESSPASVKEL